MMERTVANMDGGVSGFHELREEIPAYSSVGPVASNIGYDKVSSREQESSS
jgi:hypothetical protein